MTNLGIDVKSENKFNLKFDQHRSIFKIEKLVRGISIYLYPRHYGIYARYSGRPTRYIRVLQ